MKKRLFLLRHGRAEPHDSAGDHARPLTERGRWQARLVGELLSELSREPDRVLSSTAERARATALAAADAGRWRAPVEAHDALYLAEPRALLSEIRSRGGSAETLLVCGHEPGLSELASLLLGRARLDLPPGGLVRIDFQGADWSAVREAAGVLHSFVRPAMLG